MTVRVLPGESEGNEVEVGVDTLEGECARPWKRLGRCSEPCEVAGDAGVSLRWKKLLPWSEAEKADVAKENRAKGVDGAFSNGIGAKRGRGIGNESVEIVSLGQIPKNEVSSPRNRNR